MHDLYSFWYELEKNPQEISLLLNNGAVVSGKFSNPSRRSITIPSERDKVAVGDYLLKSVTVVQTCGNVATLPELIVPHDNIIAWGYGKLTPSDVPSAQPPKP